MLCGGLIIGIVTGVVGIGGGFLLIPALVLLVKLPMKNAVATSLFIIAIKSLIGFAGDLGNLEIKTDSGYYLLQREDKQDFPECSSVKDWLLQASRNDN